MCAALLFSREDPSGSSLFYFTKMAANRFAFQLDISMSPIDDYPATGPRRHAPLAGPIRIRPRRIFVPPHLPICLDFLTKPSDTTCGGFGWSARTGHCLYFC